MAMQARGRERGVAAQEKDFDDRAFLPDRPPRKLPSIAERARWFGERTGSLAGSASLPRLLGAIRWAERTPAQHESSRTTVSEGLQLLQGAGYRPGRKARPVVVDAHGRLSEPEILQSGKRPGIGSFGPMVSVKKFEGPWAFLAIPVSLGEAEDLDMEAGLLAQWDKDRKHARVMDASGYSLRDGLLVGRITEPGLYRPVALPRHPWIRNALDTLGLYWPWIEAEPHLRAAYGKFGEFPGFVPKICQFILCAPEVQKLSETGDLAKLGLGDIPDVPGRIGYGDMCEMCLGGLVDIVLIGGKVIQPPELDLVRRPRLECAHWTSIGPSPGPGFWGIGRITQIDIHPTNGNVLIAGASGGGVWRTDDGGGHWRPLMETEPTLTIGAVAFAPSNPQVMYAASGEDAGGYNPAWPGVGVYRSADGGAKWILAAPVSSTRFSAIVVHPTLPNTVYVAGNRGLHKSTDGGATWLTNAGLSSLFDGPITDVVIAHDQPDRVYIGVWNDGVYRSTTGGQAAGGAPAFNRLDGANQLPFSVNAAWIKLAIGRNGTNGSNFLVAKLGPDGSQIFTTADGGNTWAQQAQNVAAISFDEWASVIAVDPSNDARLYAGAATTFNRSDNGGQAWIPVSAGIHPDQQDLAFDPTNPSRIFLANDGGVYRSADAGNTWTFASGDMRTGQVYDMDIAQRDVFVAACGTQDNGIYYRSSLGVWRHLAFGWDGTQVAIDPTDPTILYFSSQNGVSYITVGGLSRSLDGGQTIQALGAVGLSGGSPWVTILKLDPTDPIATPATNRIVFVAGTNVLFRSTNGGQTWQRVNDAAGNPFTTEGTITSLEFAPSNPTVLYLGTTSGAVYRATGGGATAANWARIDAPGTPADALFPNVPVAQIGVDPNDANHAWVVFAGNGVFSSSRPDFILNPLGISHAFKTRDGGATWVDASGRFAPLHLPDVPTSAVAIDNLNADVAYVGTDVGVFRTGDGGITWNAFQDGLARSPVTELRLHRNARTLFAGTMGRGLYVRQLG